MESLSQNWIWILVAAGVLALFLFRRSHRGHGGLGHAGHGHVGYHHGDSDGQDVVPNPSRHAPEAAIDPVSGAAVRTADALTSVHQGRIYYFESKDTRDRFEASPQEYAAKATGAVVGLDPASEQPRRRRRGC